MSWTKKEMSEAYFKVQKAAVTDPAFRKELIASPKAAIEKIYGKELPEGFKVKILENDPAYAATFVLPDFIGEVLEDDDLDNVAGGTGGTDEPDLQLDGAVSVAAIVSVCGGAVALSACGANICGGEVGPVICGADACGGATAIK